MRHSVPIILVLACFAALFFACYYPVLFQDRQFGFRDAGHYYYPLYQRVQAEWDAGRWPLWEPEENAGMPLLGNPTAAVLYPGKLIYAVLPYAWGARIYVVAHSLLAFVAMLVLMRSWQVSWTGSGLSALAYAFGVPVLFQYCNIIYLVGAAWLPLGFHAVDRWVRLGRRWGLLELSIVLAMQTLGGDPQSSYLLGLAGIGYAAGLAWSRRPTADRSSAPRGDGRPAGSLRWWWFPAAALGMAGWVIVTLILAGWLPTVRPKGYPPPALPWMWYVSRSVAPVWMVAGLGFLRYWRRKGWRLPLGITWLGLVASGALAIALSAAQFLPVYEFTQLTSRAADVGIHDIYPFSLEPQRFPGLLWPNVLGNSHSESNTFWGNVLRMPGDSPKEWVPSLYLGGLILILAMGALTLRQGAPWRIWLSVILVLSIVGSLGKYTSPIWAARVLAEGTKLSALQSLGREIGPLDTDESTPIRLDRFLRDGDGSLYWWVATLLPGFRQFRYPVKLFTFACLALAALAGLGWDGLRAGGTRRFTALSVTLMALTLIVLAGVLVERSAILGTLSASQGGLYGPFHPEGAYAAIVRSLAHTAIVIALGLAAVRLIRSRPVLAGVLAILVTTGDLAAANVRYVLTIPQAVLQTTPKLVQILQDYENAHPAPGPFRVHRMPTWDPPYWLRTRSTERNQEVTVWERDTLQPKYGINYGIEYAHTMGVAELFDYDWYYGGFPRTVRTNEMARALNVQVGDEVIYFPRRSFDMWNTRYFIVPMYPNGWRDQFRGYATFLLDAETIYPDRTTFRDPKNAEETKDWMEHYDFQILRNIREHPRAWVVHRIRNIEPITGMSREERRRAMQEITYADDSFWHDPDLQAFDPLRLAWVESADASELVSRLPGELPGRAESVQVRYPNPQKVELEADLDKPGLVVLADAYYPGWELTIDGKPAPIYRVNRMMRGAVVPAGPHHLVYIYGAPQSFRIGRIVSLASLGLLVLLGVACTLRPVDPNIGPQLEPPTEESTFHE